jgi:ribonuclease HII
MILSLFQPYEDQIRQHGFLWIAGVDEAGRGPLAGPVVAAAVIFRANATITGVNDSKKLTAKKRLELFYRIRKEAVAYGIGLVNHLEIDRINILQATFKAMQMAVAHLKIQPDFILIDGNQSPFSTRNQQTIVKGDQLCFSIAAASILAKVCRDKLMNIYDAHYPHYQFRKNKGYASAAHIQAIQHYGRCPIHRQSFTLKSEINVAQTHFIFPDPH